MHIHCKPQRARLQPSTQHHPHRFDKYGPSHDSEALAAAAAGKEKPTQKSLSVHSVAHTVLSGSLFLSLSGSKAETKEGRKDTVSLTLIHPSSIRFQNAIECGERKKESKMGEGRRERNKNTYALIIWSNHHELVSFMRACNQTSICFHCLQQSSICPQILQLSFFPGDTRQEA